MSQPGRLVPAQSKEPRQPPYPTDLIWHFREKLRIPEIDDVLCRNIRQRQVRWSATLALSCFCSGPTTALTTHDGVENKTLPKDRSLLAGGRQGLVQIEEFQDKIAAARAAGREYDLLVVARTEALIADRGPRRGAEAGSCLLRSRSRYDPCSLQAKHRGVSVGSRFLLHHSS